MRLLLLTAFVSICMLSNATNYYISSSNGDDGRSFTQAQDPQTPWRSLDKLNAVFSSLQPGDTVFLKRGDVFEGTLTATRSGAAGSPVVVAAYGNGARPVISGMTSLTGFTRHEGNIWKVRWDNNRPAIFLLNARQQPLGRFPNATESNKGYLIFEQAVGGTSITDNEMPLTSNWTGGEVVIRKNRWIIDRCPITAHSSKTIWYTNTSQYVAAKGFGYFIQNHLSTLDQDGEWFYNSSQKQLYLYKENFSEATDVAEASARETLLTVSRQSHLAFVGVHFKGANDNGILINLSKNIRIADCQFTYTGMNAVSLLSSTDVQIEGSAFDYSNNNAITTSYNCNNITVSHNTITNTGTFPGMGKSGDLGYQAITVKGKNNLVSYNKIENTGYVPIRFEGDYCTVQNNFVNTFCYVKDDGAGIYTWNNDPGALENYGRIIKDNIVINGIGAMAGTTYPDNPYVHGIYLDDNSANVEITGNTVAHCGESGLYIHNSRKALVRNNTLYNNNRQAFLQHDYISNNPVRDIDMKDNVLFSKKGKQHILYFKSVKDDLESFGVADNNYYSRPFDPSPSIYTSYTRNYLEYVHSYDLSTWQGAFQQDANTKGAPLQIPPYQNNGLIGNNRIANSTFDRDIYTAYGYGWSGSFRMEWNSGGKLDGGSLQATMDVPNTRGFVIMDIGAVVAGKAYLLKFSLLGKSNNKSLAMFLRQKASPFSRISDITFCKVLSTRTENEILFIPTESMSAASIVFDVSDQQDLWMDNVGFFEANVTLPNPDETVRFEYNAGNTSKTITLDATYVDAKGKTHVGSIELPPFSSVVLMRKGPFVKQDQTITFPALAGKKYGDEPFSLLATASSGLPVSYRVVSGPASISADKLTITGAGTISVEASQPGDALYNAATPVRQELVVAKKEQTIDFAAIAGKIDGDAPFTLTATATSGLPVTFRVVSGPATVTNSTVTLTGSGEVTIEATQQGNNDFLPATALRQTFTVAEKPVIKLEQSIRFDAIADKDAGAAAFSLTATASSGLPVSFNIVSGPATLTGNLVKLTGLGVVTIEATQGGNDAYLPAPPVVQKFTVTPATKKHQTISFGSLPYKTYTSLPFTLGATSSSGLPVTYRLVTGPVTLDGDLVTIRGVGLVTIEAIQVGNDEFHAATPVVRSFTIGKASQMITFPAISNKTFGDAPFELNATSTSGLSVSYKVVSGPATIAGNIVTLTGAGQVSIEASQAGDDNYQASFSLVRSFTVEKGIHVKKAQYLNFPTPAKRIFGDAPFELNATSTSGLPVSYKVVSGPATIAGNIVTLTGAGQVSIEASQAGDDNYLEATPVTASFTVDKATQSLSFATLIYRFYTDAPFEVSATASSALPVSYKVVSGPATINGNIVTINNVGFVIIEASQAGDDNFHAAAPVLRGFTVGKASQMITFPAIGTKSVGDAPFELNATTTSGLPISYRVVSGKATITGNIVTLTGAGHVSIEASQAGNEFYVAANTITRLFTVTGRSGDADISSTIAQPDGNTLEQFSFNEMSVSPNPVATTGNITIQVAKTVVATVALFDNQGRLVKQVATRRFEKGQQNVLPLQTADLASGTYFIRFTSTTGIVMAKKLQVVK